MAIRHYICQEFKFGTLILRKVKFTLLVFEETNSVQILDSIWFTGYRMVPCGVDENNFEPLLGFFNKLMIVYQAAEKKYDK
jgi:hypothetical protein